MADIIALPIADLITDPEIITGLPGETIYIQACAGFVCVEIDDHGTVANIYLPAHKFDQFIAHCQAMRATAVRMTSTPSRKPSIWAAPSATQQPYAARLEAARKAFTAMDPDTRKRAAWLLETMGTSAAPTGTTTFADVVQRLAGYGIRDADQLFAADLRAIGRMG